MGNPQRLEPVRPVQPLGETPRERLIHRTEEQIAQEQLASRLMVTGWLIMTFVALALIFVPASFRDGGYSIPLIVIVGGALSLALIVTALVKRRRAEQAVEIEHEVRTRESRGK